MCRVPPCPHLAAGVEVFCKRGGGYTIQSNSADTLPSTHYPRLLLNNAPSKVCCSEKRYRDIERIKKKAYIFYKIKKYFITPNPTRELEWTVDLFDELIRA